MNQRPHLIEAAEVYLIEDKAFQEGKLFGYGDGLIEGRKQGIAMERSRVKKIEWSKLAALIFVMTLAAILVAYRITL